MPEIQKTIDNLTPRQVELLKVIPTTSSISKAFWGFPENRKTYLSSARGLVTKGVLNLDHMPTEHGLHVIKRILPPAETRSILDQVPTHDLPMKTDWRNIALFSIIVIAIAVAYIAYLY